MDAQVDSSKRIAHWQKSRGLMFRMLIIWFIFSFLIHAFVPAFNNITILKFKLGYYLASQGSLIVFVIMIFVFAKRQNDLDHEYGVSEDDDE